MAGLNETPSGNRVRLAFFGRRNAGKSTLINAVAGQEVAIVSDTPGTTTDPVSKAMEILPLGPCLLTDTAGLDDVGPLGELRVKKALEVLEKTDVAVIVSADAELGPLENDLVAECERRRIAHLVYRRGDSVAALKEQIARLAPPDEAPPLVADLVVTGDVVVCVCPIDSAAPKGRLILPQQQVVRELLDAGAIPVVCRETELSATLSRLASPPCFVVTDSQAFGSVSKALPREIPLTSFSIVFARAKGDLALYADGAAALDRLEDGARVLIAEGCTHHRQCTDIGTVKLPAWIQSYTGRRLEFAWVSGNDFPSDLSPYSLVVHCGGCMLSRRAVQARLSRCRAAGIPVTNYGICIATCHGIRFSPESRMVLR
jgi:small GTP-binding protein